MEDRDNRSEEALYEDDRGVIITGTRLIVKTGGGNRSRKITYAMSHITSVELITRPPNRVLGIILTILGVLILIGTVADYSTTSNHSTTVLIAGIAVGLVILVIGIILLMRAKPFYILKIGSASGKEEVILSREKGYIQPIVRAMNEAIVDMGQSAVPVAEPW